MVNHLSSSVSFSVFIFSGLQALYQYVEQIKISYFPFKSKKSNKPLLKESTKNFKIMKKSFS